MVVLGDQGVCSTSPLSSIVRMAEFHHWSHLTPEQREKQEYDRQFEEWKSKRQGKFDARRLSGKTNIVGITK